jgi:hypothetical protein
MVGMLLALTASTAPSGPPALAQQLVRPGEAEHLDLIDQKHWQGEIWLEELAPALVALLDPSKENDRRPLLADSFRGVPPAKPRTRETRTEGPLQLEHAEFAGLEPGDAARFVSRFERYRRGYDAFLRFEWHVGRLRVAEDAPRPQVDLEVDTLTVGESGALRRTDRAVWEATFVHDEEGDWQAQRLAILTLDTARGLPTFTDVTSLLPPSHRVVHPKTNRYTDFPANNGVALADWDGDGDLDLYVFRPFLTALFYENDGTGSFRENRPAGIEEPSDAASSMSGSGYFLDVDGDRDLDFLAIRNDARPRLFRNDGERFVDVSLPAGFRRLPRSYWIGATFADYDRDGDLDLYLLRYANRDPNRSYFDSPGNANHLLQNDGAGRFTDVTATSGVAKDNRRISWAAAWGDPDGDGWPDLYVANDFGPNKFYVNQGDGTFVERAEELGLEDRANGMGATWCDYDGDGNLDLYVSNMHSYAGERITRELDRELGVEGLSLPRRFSKGNALFRGRGDGTFVEVTPEVAVAEAGWAWGHVFLDHDLDGDLDLYVVNGYFSNLVPVDT